MITAEILIAFTLLFLANRISRRNRGRERVGS